jgi:hypothetical protein
MYTNPHQDIVDFEHSHRALSLSIAIVGSDDVSFSNRNMYDFFTKR